MRRYRILEPLWLSFYSKDLYRDVARNWGGETFAYLLLLVALSWIPLVVRVHWSFAKFADSEAQHFVEQIPQITIQDGEVSTDVPTPYAIKDKQGATVAIIDTTQDTPDLDALEDDVVLLTRGKLAVKQSRRRQTRIQDLSGITEFSLDRDRIRAWLETARTWLALLLFPFVVLPEYLYRLVQVALYALLALPLARGLVYVRLLRITTVAITPVLLVDTAETLVEWRIPGWSVICFGLAMGYLAFAVKANAEAEGTTSATAPQA